MMSMLSLVMSCWATWAARESLDWLSPVTISMWYFFPPIVRPLANAWRTFFSTNGFAVAKAASGPVIGLMKPILMVPVGAADPPLRPLLHAARPSPAAPAIPAIPPTKARRLRAVAARGSDPPEPPGATMSPERQAARRHRAASPGEHSAFPGASPRTLWPWNPPDGAPGMARAGSPRRRPVHLIAPALRPPRLRHWGLGRPSL